MPVAFFSWLGHWNLHRLAKIEQNRHTCMALVGWWDESYDYNQSERVSKKRDKVLVLGQLFENGIRGRGVEPHFGGYSRLNIEAPRRGFPVRPRANCSEGRGPCRGRVVKARTEQPLPRLMPCSVSWILVEMADNGFRSLCGNNGKI